MDDWVGTDIAGKSKFYQRRERDEEGMLRTFHTTPAGARRRKEVTQRIVIAPLAIGFIARLSNGISNS